MKHDVLEAIRLMPRDDLETFAARAASQLRINRGEIEAGQAFLTALIAFLLGAIVAASGFLVGMGLG